MSKSICTSFLLFSVGCLFAVSNIFSQHSGIEAKYEIKLGEDDFFFDSQLITDGSSSVFRFKYNESSPWFLEREGYSQTVFTDSLGEIVFNQNLRNPKIKVRGFCYAAGVFIYEDSVSFNWIIKKQEKMINGVLCRKAVCDFRGRKYEVYFNPEIPSFAGSWKFAGLPGLIYQVKDSKEEVVISIKSLKVLKEVPDILYNFTASGNLVTHLEAVQCLDNEWLKRLEKQKAAVQQIQAQYPDLEIEFEAGERRAATELEFE